MTRTIQAVSQSIMLGASLDPLTRLYKMKLADCRLSGMGVGMIFVYSTSL